MKQFEHTMAILSYGEPILQKANEMGLEGWELIGVFDGSPRESVCLLQTGVGTKLREINITRNTFSEKL